MNIRFVRASGSVAVFAGMALLLGCARLKVEPVEVEVKPIHVTVDVNIKIQKVDRALDDFFSDISGPAGEGTPAAAPANDSSKEAQP